MLSNPAYPYPPLGKRIRLLGPLRPESEREREREREHDVHLPTNCLVCVNDAILPVSRCTFTLRAPSDLPNLSYVPSADETKKESTQGHRNILVRTGRRVRALHACTARSLLLLCHAPCRRPPFYIHHRQSGITRKAIENSSHVPSHPSGTFDKQQNSSGVFGAVSRAVLLFQTCKARVPFPFTRTFHLLDPGDQKEPKQNDVKIQRSTTMPTHNSKQESGPGHEDKPVNKLTESRWLVLLRNSPCTVPFTHPPLYRATSGKPHPVS